MTEPTPESDIELYFECNRCFEELPAGESPSDYADISIGWTKQGVQVWCDRHNINLIHIDFEGAIHRLVGDPHVKKSQ